ncbi:MAG: hypothetical protein AAF702_45680 [Chloroflexota bacterium]
MGNRTGALVLWDKFFDESLAVIFVTEFRRAKIPVRLVGLRREQLAGRYGLTLYPDIGLREAIDMATYTNCVVIPCELPGLKRIERDPRIYRLLDRANANNAQFVLNQSNPNTNGEPSILIDYMDKVTIFPERTQIMLFAQSIICNLI